MLKYSSGVNEMYSCVDAESMAQKCQHIGASIRQITIRRGSLLPGRWQSRDYLCEMVKERVNIRKEKKKKLSQRIEEEFQKCTKEGMRDGEAE